MAPVSLNIKNESTHALVRELAQLTGMSQTDAVTDAVRRRLAQLRAETEAERDERAREVRELVQQLAPRLRAHYGDRDPFEEFYDENGLPR